MTLWCSWICCCDRPINSWDLCAETLMKMEPEATDIRRTMADNRSEKLWNGNSGSYPRWVMCSLAEFFSEIIFPSGYRGPNHYTIKKILKWVQLRHRTRCIHVRLTRGLISLKFHAIFLRTKCNCSVRQRQRHTCGSLNCDRRRDTPPETEGNFDPNCTFQWAIFPSELQMHWSRF